MRIQALLLAGFLGVLSTVAGAQEPEACLPAPSGDIILEITGDISCGNAHEGDNLAAHFDAALLESLGTKVLETTTDWTNGSQRFEGPLMRDILQKVQASGTVVHAVAANDYAVTIPREDFEDYQVILAMSQNGKRLSLRDRGPLWIIYPRDGHPELRTPVMNTRWIWQLRTLDVR
jgi:hypothetical protein